MKNKTSKTKLFAPNSRPKTVNVTFTRKADGSYHVEGATYMNRVNQFRTRVRRLDARDTAAELKMAAKVGNITVR